MTEVRLLHSTDVTPLQRYYEPLRLPTAAASRLCIPCRRCGGPDGLGWGGARARPLTPLSPHAATRGHSASTCCVSPDRSRHVGPPRFLTIPSVRALPINPGQPRRVLSLIASLPVADFAPSGGFVAAISITRPYGFAFAGLTPSPSGEFFPFAPWPWGQGTGLLSGVGYPPPKVRGFVLNEQLSRLTPFSQMGWPSFAWRTRFW